MKFKGMNRDIHPDELKDGHWRDAQNMVFNSKRQRLESEEGIAVFNGSLSTSQHIGIIPLNEGCVNFKLDTATGTGYILRVDAAGTGTTVLATTELGFTENNWIRGVYHYNFKGLKWLHVFFILPCTLCQQLEKQIIS